LPNHVMPFRHRSDRSFIMKNYLRASEACGSGCK